MTDRKALIADLRRRAETQVFMSPPGCGIVADALAEADAEIERLETNLRHWREECGKLHSQIDRHRRILNDAINDTPGWVDETYYATGGWARPQP